jgi:hypothetical protein
VAAEITKLKDQIAALLANPDAITPEESAVIIAGLQAQVDRLNSLGADAANPIPPPPPPAV